MRALRGLALRGCGRARLELLLVHGAQLLELLLPLLAELRAERLHLILLGGDALVVRGGQLGQLVLLLLLHHALDLLHLRVLDLLQLLAPVAHLRHLVLPIAQRLLQLGNLLPPRHERALLLLQAALQRVHLAEVLLALQLRVGDQLLLLMQRRGHLLLMRVLMVHGSAVAVTLLWHLHLHRPLLLLLVPLLPRRHPACVRRRHLLIALLIARVSPLRLRLLLCRRRRWQRGSTR